MRVIDMRSDTVTLPTDEMRRAMYSAEVGDDVYGEDPTVNTLEQLAAQMLKKEAALFTSSGIMSNLLAVLTHTRPGDEILLGSEAHMLWYELGGASALGGVVMRTILNARNGSIDLERIEDTIRTKNTHFPRTTLLCLENTQNRCGGTILTPVYTRNAAKLAHQHGLLVHMDGARIFNAAVALDIAVSELVKDMDSACFCLSKGLSAPVGSLLCGTREFVENARKWRRMIGGGMRQAGIIAAAGIVALQEMVSRLEEDHHSARRLAIGLNHISGITVLNEEVQTNIVLFDSATTVSGPELMRQLEARGIKFGYHGNQGYRAVTHRMVDTADIDEALNRIELCVKKTG